jgi:hypothetical protein
MRFFLQPLEIVFALRLATGPGGYAQDSMVGTVSIENLRIANVVRQKFFDFPT